ncbi:MAG: HAMP domain-containing sensor histidine kinase [Maribacter sp.]|uniref:sensor histidine kinase n=1 Tax=Maribacter sp. TaxID=1897614 RepID=UPI003C792350
MISIEAKLKERIKELTCLYEVTSIIVNSDYDQLETSLEAIVYSLKKAWQFEDVTEVLLSVGDYKVKTEDFRPDMVDIKSDIKVFNKVDGQIIVGYPSEKYAVSDFLDEEKILLDNVSLAVGNLLERKQIRDSEAAARRQMERTDRLHILGEITAGIAHELNTPLANILGFAELLKEKVSKEENVRDLKKIMDNAIFSREIVKKLMFFACEMPQEMKTVELKPAIENVLKLLGPSLREKNINLTKSFSNDAIKLRADTVQLTQVLFNLIMNAAYYSPTGSTIDVNVTAKEKKIRIQISDQGKGIAPEIEDKIFEPFFTTKPIGEGSGLGLSVVHGIISSHKGSISHQPNTPKGAIFTVDFPKL